VAIHAITTLESGEEHLNLLFPTGLWGFTNCQWHICNSTR